MTASDERPTGLPDTPACRAADDVARAYCSTALHHHSVRSFVYAVEVARQDGIAYDEELLYVSAMLHDLALTPEFDNHTLPFEMAGGHVARVFAAGAGWPAARGVRAAEVIERHMWPAVDPALDPEGYLLEVGTGIDISGTRAGDIPEQLRDATLVRWPRGSLAVEFTAAFHEQGRRKPSCRAAALAEPVRERLARHPHEGP